MGYSLFRKTAKAFTYEPEPLYRKGLRWVSYALVLAGLAEGFSPNIADGIDYAKDAKVGGLGCAQRVVGPAVAERKLKKEMGEDGYSMYRNRLEEPGTHKERGLNWVGSGLLLSGLSRRKKNKFRIPVQSRN
jgi:hypothetical protein